MSSVRRPRAAARSYYEADYIRSPRSIRGAHARYRRSHDFEDIFNQAPPDASNFPDQDLGIQHWWNR